MDQRDATWILYETERLQARTRHDLQGLWFPLLLFGALMLGGAGVAAALSGLAVAIYWGIAGPVGGAVCAAYFWRRSIVEGLGPASRTPAVVGAGIVAGCLTGYALGLRIDATFAAATPFMVISAGYAVIARTERRLRFSGIALALGGSAFALGMSGMEPATVTSVLSLAYGATFILYGFTFLSEQRRT